MVGRPVLCSVALKLTVQAWPSASSLTTLSNLSSSVRPRSAAVAAAAHVVRAAVSAGEVPAVAAVSAVAAEPGVAEDPDEEQSADEEDVEQLSDEEDVSFTMLRALSLVPRDGRVRALIRDFFRGEEGGERGWTTAAASSEFVRDLLW